MAKNKDLIERVQSAISAKAPWESVYKTGYEYVNPYFDDFYKSDHLPPRDNAEFVFSSAPTLAFQKFVSNLMNTFIPKGKKWRDLVIGPLLESSISEEERNELKLQASNVRDILFANLESSNFYKKAAEAFHDVGLGMGNMLAQPHPSGIGFNFIAVPLSRVYLEPSFDGEVSGVFREVRVPKREVFNLWPDFTIPSNGFRDKKDDEEILFYEGTIPEEIMVPVIEDNRTIMVPAAGYRYFVIDKSGDNIFVDRKETETPWLNFRWSVPPGQVYGIGPVLFALPDIKFLNKLREQIMQNVELSVAGVWTAVEGGLIGVDGVKMVPGAIFNVLSNPGGPAAPSIAPLPRNSRIDIGKMEESNLINSINDALLVDPLGPVDLPVKSATEVAMRQQAMTRRNASAFNRLSDEFIVPLINRCLSILESQGQIDLSGFRVDGLNLSLKDISPLSQAQESDDFFAIQNHVSFMTQVFGPNAILGYKPEKLARVTGELLNVPPEVLQDEAGFSEISSALPEVDSSTPQQ